MFCSPCRLAAAVSLAICSVVVCADSTLEEIRVFAQDIIPDTVSISPTSKFNIEDLDSVNITTAEDILTHAPSLAVRRRFIGDPNGVVGARGSNMFQTPRTLVYVDGMPIHYHLQTRFRGSPRWSLVSPDEVQVAEVLYGPYSAEYSGNAMGAVINLKTRKPQSKRVVVEAAYFAQDYERLSIDDTFDGYRFYSGYENSYGNLGVFASYTRLENDSHPQTEFRSSITTDNSGALATGGTPVTGAIAGITEQGEPVLFFGNSGPERAITNLYKTKFVYDFDAVELRATIAYEDRTRSEERSNNFLVDAGGNSFYENSFNVDGFQYSTFEFGRSLFQDRTLERESLLLGVGARFNVSNTWIADAFYSYFDLIRDEEIRTGENPASPNFVQANNDFRARLTSYDDTGWDIFDLKFSTQSLLGDDRRRLAVGFHYDSYELKFIVDDYNSITRQRDADDADGSLFTGRGDSGGKARTYAAFVQYGMRLSDKWDLSFGLRYEDWQASDGFIAATNFGGGPNTVTFIDKVSKQGWSPKFSFTYSPNNAQNIRYSVARALRFPVVEELFLNGSDLAGGSVADPNLEPEDGVFHNLSFRQQLDTGSITLNFFYDTVEETIFNQEVAVGSGSSNTVETFLPISEVRTQGSEFVASFPSLFIDDISLTVNLVYTDTEITKNANNTDIIGNRFPRIARWRSNLLLNYNVSDVLDVGTTIRTASDTFGTLDNSDNVDRVFGTHDKFTFVGLKANWQALDDIKLSFGVDNVFDYQAYVRFPYPARTFYLSAKYLIAE